MTFMPIGGLGRLIAHAVPLRALPPSLVNLARACYN